MANYLKGKLFLFCFLFVLASPPFYRVLASSNSLPIESGNGEELDSEDRDSGAEAPSGFDQQRVLLQRLDEIVRNLSEIVARLETKSSGPSRIARSNEKRELEGGSRPDLLKNQVVDQGDINIDGIISDEEESSGVQIVGDENKPKPLSVTRFSPFWSERFHFVAAVKLDSQATCINVLPFRDYEGLSKYVAVGDEAGMVYVFLRNGEVQVQFQTLSDSPITAMVSYLSTYKNESFVVTGHKNGMVLMHRVWEGSAGEDWNSLSMKNVVKLLSPNGGENDLAISILEVHHAGRLRYILATDASGKIWVFRENGTVYGSTMPSSKPLAFLRQRLLFLTETGAGSLDLRSMKVRESQCEGLNHSLATNYVFDVTERSKAYGFTSEGDLIHVLLLGDIMNFKCRVRSKRKFDMNEPLAFEAIKGYLLVVSEDKVFVYNVSTQHYVRIGAPRILFSAGLDEIRASFLNHQRAGSKEDKRKQAVPLIASNREKFVVVGLGGGYVGIYRSNLPVYKGESSTMFWTSPVLFFVLFLFAAWHFFAKKKEALTSWGPDDPFTSTSTSTTTGALLAGSNTGERADRGERSFMDSSSRNADMMDLRGSGLRGPARRYVSPPRFPGGAANSFRPGSVDQRVTSVDPNFRTSELKYRGTGLESSGFPKRRESLFVNTQGVDDSN